MSHQEALQALHITDGKIPLTGQEKLKQLQQKFRQMQFSCFADWLKFYLQMDCDPFLECAHMLQCRIFENYQW